MQGRLFVRNAAGRLVAELAKEPSLVVGLGLPAGQYRVTLEQGQRLYEATVDRPPRPPRVLGPAPVRPGQAPAHGVPRG